MNQGWSAALGAATLAAAIVAAAATPASAQDIGAEISRVDSEIVTLRGQLDQLRPQHLIPEQILRDYSFATAFVDARYLFNVQSYAATTELLLPLVEGEANRANAGWEEAVFMLAESLFQQRNLLMSRRYYELLDDSRVFGLDSARRRLEIALAMGRYETLDRLYEDLNSRSAAGADDQVAYVRGKALYFQGRYADGINAFNGVRPGALVYDLARYFVGVSHARMNQLDRAHSEFDGILDRIGTPTAGEIEALTDLRHLTQLAKGRIFYEEQLWLDAIDEYVGVPRNSPRYDAALYEIAWTQIRQGGETDDADLRNQYYRTALNNLEILGLVAGRDSRFQAQAALLRGDLLLRTEEYERAVVQFNGVADTYYPVELELREIRDSHDDPNDFFDAIVNPEEGTLRLPIAARPWFDSDPQLDRALNAIQDVDQLADEIAETEQLIEELDAVLNTGGRVNAFPRLREGWGRALAIQSQATVLAIALVDAEAAQIAPRLSGVEAQEYEAFRRRRLALQSAIVNQPRSFAEIGEREERVIEEINNMVLEVHRTELQIEASRRDLDALRELYIDRAGNNPSVDLRALRTQLDAEARRLDQFEAAAQRMRRELNVRQVTVGVSDEVGAAERAARVQFLTALGEEERYLAGRRATAPSAGASFSSIDRLLRAITDIDNDCEDFYRDVDLLVAEQTADLRDLLEGERANVERYHERILVADAEARSTAGAVAFGAFEDVYFRFSEITLRASLGVIDVAWQQKEELTGRIEQLFEDRNESIRELDADFAELLEDE